MNISPSTQTEINEAENFDFTQSPPFDVGACYDHERRPWTFWHGDWFRTETIGATDYKDSKEKPTWQSE